MPEPEQPLAPEGPDADDDAPTAPPTTPHDPAGLDTARALASRLRGASARWRARTPERRLAPGEVRVSGARPDDRDPALLGVAVDKLVTESGWVTDVAVYGVFGRWEQIVGSDIAAHCTPESFDGGRLTVRTDSTAWATQLRLLAPNVVRRLNEELGEDTVARLDVAGPVAPSWRRGRRTVRGGRGPRDTYG